ncbi:DAN domain family member 5-like isoform X1 [Tenebrio molitor]|uniref:DAN domain family member 5-like isoform X1 n=2 Tax=Tenebrio molitor TaxID=7067 RepID=UPI00362474BF
MYQCNADTRMSTLRLVFCVLFVQQLGCCACVRNPPSDSILDIINTKEVERLIAEKKQNASREEKRYLLENELDENYIPPDQEFEIQKLKLLDEERSRENPRVDINLFLRRNNHSDPYRSTELLQDLRGFNGRKLLKSSKNALFVTKKEYLQRDWCKTEPLIQKVKEEGCLTRTVINRFCYGQCNSFYIPKNPKRRHKHSEETEDEDQNGPAFKACAFCRPSKFTWVTITLKCPSMTPPFRKKRVQRIKQCKCTAVNVN